MGAFSDERDDAVGLGERALDALQSPDVDPADSDAAFVLSSIGMLWLVPAALMAVLVVIAESLDMSSLDAVLVGAVSLCLALCLSRAAAGDVSRRRIRRRLSPEPWLTRALHPVAVLLLGSAIFAIFVVAGLVP
jgi:hypothetical protein